MKDLPTIGIDACDPNSRGSYTAIVYHYSVHFNGYTITDYGRGPIIEGLGSLMPFKAWVESLSISDFKELIDLMVNDEDLMNVLGGSNYPTETWAATVKINGYDRNFTAPVIQNFFMKVQRNPKPCLP
jgi:hypothetical protein